jgi:hypothetical protein
MACDMTELQQRKRELIARSDLWRRTLVSEVAQVEAATLWIPRTLHYARMAAPVLAMALPVAGWVLGFRRRSRGTQKPPPKRNLLGTVIAGYQLARRVKPIWNGFHRMRTPH